MYMILFVLDDPEKLDDVLDAWESVGITGVTILESTGIQRRRTARKRVPMRYRLAPMIQHEEGHYTLMAIVQSKEIVQKSLQSTEQLIGDLKSPNTGVFTAWPLDVVAGVSLDKKE